MKKQHEAIEIPEEGMEHICPPYSGSRQAAGEDLPVSDPGCLSD
jgi:hypothetical protein